MKKIVISGASGFVGTHLSGFLSQNGYAIDPLSREDLNLSDLDLSERLNGTTAVINLAGAPIIHRWTPLYKEELYTSRIRTTQKIANAIRLTTTKPEVFISGLLINYICIDLKIIMVIFGQPSARNHGKSQKKACICTHLCQPQPAHHRGISDTLRSTISQR